MRVLSTVLLLFVTSQGLATTIGKQVQSLVGKKLTSSLAIINKINEADELGRTALHHAIMLGKLPLVEFFIDNGADLRAADNNNKQYTEKQQFDHPCY